jgi:outer membrane protein assembly factor BamA
MAFGTEIRHYVRRTIEGASSTGMGFEVLSPCQFLVFACANKIQKINNDQYTVIFGIFDRLLYICAYVLLLH